MLYMLDTDVASFAIKGRAEVQLRLGSIPPSNVCISAVTRAELLYGLERLPADHRLYDLVRRFLDVVKALPWGETHGGVQDAAAWYATIRRQLVSSGQPIGEMDMMIAAHALAVQATLVTNNTQHFGRIDAPLTMEQWVE